MAEDKEKEKMIKSKKINHVRIKNRMAEDSNGLIGSLTAAVLV